MSEALLASSLVGREHHLASVRGWVSELSDGRGRAALVEGEPGIGKSSMLRAAATDAEESGCQVFWGGCDELSQAFPLLPLIDAFDERDTGRGQARIAEMLRVGAAPGTNVDLVAAAAERLLSR